MKFKHCNSFKDYLKEIGFRLDIEVIEHYFDNGFLYIQYNDLIKHYKDSIGYNTSSIYNSINVDDELSILRKLFSDETIEKWKIDDNSEYMKLKTFDFISCEIRYDEEKFEKIIDNLKKIIFIKRDINKGNNIQGDDFNMNNKNNGMNNDNGVGVVYGGTTTVNNVAGMNMSIPNFNTVAMACNGNDTVNTSNLAMNGILTVQPAGGMMGGMMNTINFYSTDNQEAVMISQRFRIDFMTSKHILHLIKNYIATSSFKCDTLIDLLVLNKGSLVARTRIYQKETETTREIINLKSNEQFISEYKNIIERLNIEYNSLLEIQNKICRALESIKENSDSIGLTIFSDILTIVYKLNDPNLNDYLIEYCRTQNRLFLDRIGAEDNPEIPRDTRNVATNYYQANK